jgi:hypothetical protein
MTTPKAPNGNCPVCAGTQQCQMCSGEGGFQLYERSARKLTLAECGVCFGTGKCFYCCADDVARAQRGSPPTQGK